MDNNSFNIQSIFHQGKIFFLSFISVFVVASLLNAGIKAPQLINPVAHVTSTHDIITELLTKNGNNFTLKQHHTLVKETQAASLYDQASAYIVVDFASGTILKEKNKDTRLPIASLTKVISAIVGSDLATTDDVFTVSSFASRVEPTSIGVVPNQRMHRDELLWAMILTSANDATQVLKEGVDQK